MDDWERAAARALADVRGRLPELAALSWAVRVRSSARYPVAAVRRDGLVLVHPRAFPALHPDDALFVMAHELMHLRLRIHARGDVTTDRLALAIAHDFVINDELSERLGRLPPAGGLHRPGARHFAAEDLLAEARELAERMTEEQRAEVLKHVLDDHEGDDPAPSLGGERGEYQSDGVEVGSSTEDIGVELDVLSRPKARELERLLHARHGSPPLTRLRAPHALDRWDGKVPWAALIVPERDTARRSVRSFCRPSRRALSSEPILAGRAHGPATVTVVLDVSSSMGSVGKFLGALAGWAEEHQLSSIRILQVDGDVRADELVAPEDLDLLLLRSRWGDDLITCPERCAKCKTFHAWRSPHRLTDLRAGLGSLEAEAHRGPVLVATDGFVRVPDESDLDLVFCLVPGGKDPCLGRSVWLR